MYISENKLCDNQIGAVLSNLIQYVLVCCHCRA